MTDFSAPGVFNALDYGMAAGTTGLLAAQNNAKFLQEAIDAAQASGNPNGAVVLIPSFSLDSMGDRQYKAYEIACQTGDTSAVKIPNMGSATPILICGTGGGTQLTMLSANDVLFDVQSDSVSFQDLTINFDPSTSGLGTAFAFSGASGSGPANCNLFRVTILNTQNPVVLDGTKHARLLECYIDYGDDSLAFTDSAAVQITGGSDDTVISHSILFWSASTPVAPNYGIFIDGASNVKVSDTQVSSFGTCIQIQGTNSGTTGVRINGCDFYGPGWSGAYGPAGSCAVINHMVSDICFMNCHFEAEKGYTGTSPGIAIGMNGGTNSEIDTVRLISCGLTGGSGMGLSDSYGLQIGVGQNIQILGGHYSGNGATGGITIGGGATQVQIIGANCIGLEYEAANLSTPLYQLHGVLVTNGTGIQIIGVNCSGNGQPGDPGSPGDGIHIDGTDGTVSDVRIIGAVCTGGPVFDSPDITQQTGIYVKDAQGVLVKDCTLSGSVGDSGSGSGCGLYLAAASDVTVKACDLYGNVTGLEIDAECTRIFVRDCNAKGYSPYTDAISIAASLSQVEVTNCAGYNDQHPTLTSLPPSGTFSGITVDSYYGPTVFYVTQHSVTIDHLPTNLSSGGFTLAPGETGQVVGSSPQTFVMIGN